jgi:hypothetical protein
MISSGEFLLFGRDNNIYPGPVWGRVTVEKQATKRYAKGPAHPALMGTFLGWRTENLQLRSPPCGPGAWVPRGSQ